MKYPRPPEYVEAYLLKGPSLSSSAALFMMSKRRVPSVTWVVYEAGIGLPTLASSQYSSMVTVIIEGGI